MLYVNYITIKLEMGFPGGKESACNAEDPDNLGSIPGSGRYPGEENGNPP